MNNSRSKDCNIYSTTDMSRPRPKVKPRRLEL